MLPAFSCEGKKMMGGLHRDTCQAFFQDLVSFFNGRFPNGEIYLKDSPSLILGPKTDPQSLADSIEKYTGRRHFINPHLIMWRCNFPEDWSITIHMLNIFHVQIEVHEDIPQELLSEKQWQREDWEKSLIGHARFQKIRSLFFELYQMGIIDYFSIGFEDQIFGNPAKIYIIEKFLSTSRLKSTLHYNEKVQSDWVLFIDEVNSVFNSSAFVISLDKNFLKGYLKCVDERLILSIGKDLFEKLLNNLGISLKKWFKYS